MVPSYRLVIVTAALSLCTSQTLSNCCTLSPTFTNLSNVNVLQLFPWFINNSCFSTKCLPFFNDYFSYALADVGEFECNDFVQDTSCVKWPFHLTFPYGILKFVRYIVVWPKSVLMTSQIITLSSKINVVLIVETEAIRIWLKWVALHINWIGVGSRQSAVATSSNYRGYPKALINYLRIYRL